MFKPAAAVCLAVLALASMARAEVIDSQAGGFTIRDSRLVKAPPDRVWATLVQPARWWSSEHTYSHDARNLTLTPRPGGDWLETLPNGGGVRHMAVVFAAPLTTLRLEGGLGPLQALGVAGHLTFTLTPDGEATLVTLTYDVGGHAPGGLDKLAAPVDAVLGEQLGRLATAAEGGKSP